MSKQLADKQTVLVTGSSGYIGSEVVKQLLATNKYHIKALDLTPYSKFKLNNLEMITGNLTDKRLLKRTVEDVDVVVHLAAAVGRCEKYSVLAEKVNVEGTKRLFETAKKAGVRKFLFASTCSLYGFTTKLSDEDSYTYATDVYTKTKLEAETHLANNCDALTKVLIMRFANAYGGRRRLRWYHLNGFVKEALTGKLVVYSPESVRPLIHVEDLAKTIIGLVGSEQKARLEVFNVGGDNYTKLQIAEAVREFIPVEVSVKNGLDERSYPTSFAKIESLGFTLSRSIRNGILDVLNFLEGGGEQNAI